MLRVNQLLIMMEANVKRHVHRKNHFGQLIINFIDVLYLSLYHLLSLEATHGKSNHKLRLQQLNHGTKPRKVEIQKGN
jgi:hypothetical protein